MRMIDLERKASAKKLQIYLSPEEAQRFSGELLKLLKDPEAKEHFHLDSEDMFCELSCSIVTENKLKNLSSYTKLEQKILSEK